MAAAIKVRRWVGALAAVGALALAPGAFAIGGAQGDVESARRALDFVESELSSVEARYIQPASLESAASLETRFAQARLAYELGQYDRASILFLDIIERSESEPFGARRDALFYLGDSLAKQRNFLGAKTYLRELEAMGPGERHQDALAKLLEIAYATNNYEGVDALYAKIDGASGAPASLYVRAKGLYRQGKMAEARRSFLAAARAPEFALKGRYFAGVTLVEEGSLKEAMALFEQVADREATREDDLPVQGLARLAVARLAYEASDYERALGIYQLYPRRDPNFPRALYEAAWVYIQLGRFDQAESLVSSLLLAEPDLELYTDALLLRAELKQRAGRREEAAEDYEEVLAQYVPVRDALVSFGEEHGDLRAYFLSRVGEDLSVAMPSEFPPIKTGLRVVPASEWFLSGGELGEARARLRDVRQSRANLESAGRDLRAITARLNSGSRVKSFPKLSEAMQVVVGLESQLIEALEQLVTKEAASGGYDRARWSAIEAELERLAARHNQIPSGAEALAGRDAAVGSQMGQLRSRLDELGYTIGQLRGELAAVEELAAKEGVELDAARRAEADALRAELGAELASMEREQLELKAEVEATGERMGGPTIGDGERALRARYRRALLEALTFLGAGSRPEVERAARADQRISEYYARLDGFISDRVARVRETVEGIQAGLQAQRGELASVAAAAQGLAAEIALRNYAKRRAQFDGIVLRADVGRIDAMYRLKDRTSEQINKLFERRTEELRSLQENFEEVR